MAARSGFGGWQPRRLSTRIVAIFLALLLAVQLASYGAVNWSIDHNARRLLARDLEIGERIWQRLLAQRGQKLAQGAEVLAADFGFRAAMASGDTATLASALDNHGARIGASVTAMLAPDLRPVALGEGTDGRTLAALQPLAARIARDGSALALVGGRPVQLVMVPMKAPLLVGWVVMGFALDAALLQDMQAVSGLHAALLVRGGDGREAVVLTTLPADAAADLLADAPDGDGVVLAGAPHVLRRIAQVDAAPGDAGANGSGLRTLLLRSVAEAVAPYRRLQAALALITLLGLVGAGAASVFTARRMTTPLRALVQAAERLRRGQYDTALQPNGRRDEIGELATAFDRMRLGIAAHEAEIQKLAYWDRLTGLPNRARFRDAVQAAIAGAAGGAQPVAVVMLDLDRFKHVNDVLGYAIGDRLLKAVAERLSGPAARAARGTLVARLAGDEFALLLPGSDEVQARTVAEGLAEDFQQPLTLDEHTVDLAAGFGIACWPLHAADADTLISRAEVAMYSAKRQATAVQVYDPAIDAGSALTLSLLTELRRALERDELRLFLQPKVALRGAAAGRLVGAEALVRWQHPARGMVPPLEFIPFAEQTGFVRQLTLWVFEATVRHWATLRALGLQRVSVNLSTRDLLDAELPAKLGALLRRHGVPAQAFCLEITESAIMDEPQRALATLNTLSQAGFKLSIDDFGTGYSSLAYLKRLPVDELKIDRSFVMAMVRDDDDAKIVRSTIDLAHNLGLSVVAEGVEDADTLARLAALHCDEAQGYHVGRPLPAAELPAFAAHWNARADASPAPQSH